MHYGTGTSVSLRSSRRAVDTSTMDDSGSGIPDRIDLRVPGNDRFLEMLRGVVGRAARAAGFTFDGIEDLALAVDEAAILLLEAEPDQLRLEIEGVNPASGRLRAVITLIESSTPWPTPHLRDGMRWQVLSALIDEIVLLDDGRAGISLSQRVR